jgi:glyoxylase-like metal-dependent hydrolase (beta-lactamase superfamily II)
MQETLYSLLTGLPDDTLILPGHGGSTTVSYERMIEGFDD